MAVAGSFAYARCVMLTFFIELSVRINMKLLFTIAFTMPIYMMHSGGEQFDGALLYFWFAFLLTHVCTGVQMVNHLYEKNPKNSHTNSSEIILIWICCLSIGNFHKFSRFNYNNLMISSDLHIF